MMIVKLVENIQPAGGCGDDNMTSKAKTKGNNFERDIAALLNDLFSTEEFHRAPTSGAFFGRSNAFKKAGASAHAKETLTGDLTTPSDFPYTIECKCYDVKTAPNVFNILGGLTDSMMDKWLDQVTDDATFKGKQPLLFFKITPKKGTYFVLRADVANNIGCDDITRTKYTSSRGVNWNIYGIQHINVLNAK